VVVAYAPGGVLGVLQACGRAMTGLFGRRPPAPAPPPEPDALARATP
jgi:hypothetical protein